KVYALNGAIYVADCEWLIKSRTFLSAETVAYEMQKERAIDIDNEFDFAVAELFLEVPHE
ncbi:MAG TPA: hypothetical protein VJ508_04455, partial [Saprospiraceae bacterium]|nr:hypothetical protein [Saprospiraceae bacterium]